MMFTAGLAWLSVAGMAGLGEPLRARARQDTAGRAWRGDAGRAEVRHDMAGTA